MTRHPDGPRKARRSGRSAIITFWASCCSHAAAGAANSQDNRIVGPPMRQKCKVRVICRAIHRQDEARDLGAAAHPLTSTSVARRPIRCTLFMSFLPAGRAHFVAPGDDTSRMVPGSCSVARGGTGANTTKDGIGAEVRLRRYTGPTRGRGLRGRVCVRPQAAAGGRDDGDSEESGVNAGAGAACPTSHSGTADLP